VRLHGPKRRVGKNPEDLLAEFKNRTAPIPGERIFNDPKYQTEREKWVAAKLEQGLEGERRNGRILVV
jgi:hypothetical protein